MRCHYTPGLALTFIDCKRQTIVHLDVEDMQLDTQVSERARHATTPARGVGFDPEVVA